MRYFSIALVIIAFLFASFQAHAVYAPGDAAPIVLLFMASVGAISLFFRR